jgi:SnoaL-like domain
MRHPEQHPEVPPAHRAEIADALYRYATGMDLHDRALFESAFSSDAMLDFTSPARGLETTVLWLPSLLATRAAGPISLSDRRRKAGLRVR